MLRVIMLNGVMLNVVMLSVVMLSVVATNLGLHNLLFELSKAEAFTEAHVLLIDNDK